MFGRWQGLVDTTSADHDEKYLNISIVDFSKAKYISDHVEFVGRETAYRNFEPVQELDKTGYDILDALSPDQIIPFLLIAGQFMQTSLGYSPHLLEGMDHAKVKPKLPTYFISKQRHKYGSREHYFPYLQEHKS
jgi:hypothetical protein